MSKINCFMMMQFNGEHQDRIFEEVTNTINRVNAAKEYSIEVNRADLGIPLSISSIEEHLKTFIDNCDFAIAEISQLNPNVMFEMGYAIGIDKPVIIMVQEDVTVPADFSGRLFFQYKIDELNLIPQRLQGFIKSAIEAKIVQKQKSKYLVQAYANRSFSDMKERTKEAEKSIAVLTTNLNSFVDSGLLKIVKKRMVENVNLEVKILTLDPESDFAAHRARQLKTSIRFFREQLRKSLETTSSTFSDFPNRCSIATFDEFPPQITFRIDDTVYSSVVSSNQQSRNNLLLRFNEEYSGVQESILSHFDTVWGRSTSFQRIYDIDN